MITTSAGAAYAKSVLDANNITDPVNSPILAKAIPYPRMQESCNIYFDINVVTSNALQLNDTAKKTLGYDKEQSFIGLVFNNGPVSLSQLRWYFHHQYGNCFQFNTVIR